MHPIRLSYRAFVARSEKCRIHESWHFGVRGTEGKDNNTVMTKCLKLSLFMCRGDLCLYMSQFKNTHAKIFIKKKKKKKTITKALRIVLAIASAILYSEEEQRMRGTESSNRIYDSQC